MEDDAAAVAVAETAIETIGVRKGCWTEEEDDLLKQCIEKYGEGNWYQVPRRAGVNRCRKSCRLRWLNYLRPNIKRGQFTSDEVDLLIRLHKLLGNRWSLIAGRLPGRTANGVKNYWNTYLHKKSSAQPKFTSNQGVSERATPPVVEIIKPQPLTFKKTSSWLVGAERKPVDEPKWAVGPAEESGAWWENLLEDKMDSTWSNSNSGSWYGPEPSGYNDPWPIVDGHNDLDDLLADVGLWDIMGP
ncbi:hypothetical protein Ancab_032519 [Ancistrocladus abbreviatus]